MKEFIIIPYKYIGIAQVFRANNKTFIKSKEFGCFNYSHPIKNPCLWVYFNEDTLVLSSKQSIPKQNHKFIVH